jgi:arylesterase / paraoxonase
MKNRISSSLYHPLITLILLCMTQQVVCQIVEERIPVMPGPEDMVLDTLHGDPALIISCCGRREADRPFGEMVHYHLQSGEQVVMKRTNEPGDLLFRPHGICLDGDLLYVISHEKEPDYHPVLVYRVAGTQLEFLELIITGRQHSPNALVTGPAGEIYLVNDAGKRGSMMEKALKLKRASVEKLVKNQDGNWEATTMASGLGYPAGINRIGDMLYVGDAVLNIIHPYRISGEGLTPEEPFTGLKGNDNIRIYRDKLLVPGHVKFMKFIKHTRSPEKKSPVDVFLVDPLTGEHSVLYSTDGSAISAGSTAIIFRNNLYISQIFDPFILKVELD